jgi:DNA-binding NtrC family response regulator
MWRSRQKILLVDDEPAALLALRLLLERRFDIETAATAEEAKRMADARGYAAVLTDHDLPGCTGAWLLTYLAATQPGPRRILCCHREVPHLAELLAAGIVDRFLEMPTTPEELLEALLGARP